MSRPSHMSIRPAGWTSTGVPIRPFFSVIWRRSCSGRSAGPKGRRSAGGSARASAMRRSGARNPRFSGVARARISDTSGSFSSCPSGTSVAIEMTGPTSPRGFSRRCASIVRAIDRASPSSRARSTVGVRWSPKRSSTRSSHQAGPPSRSAVPSRSLEKSYSNHRSGSRDAPATTRREAAVTATATTVVARGARSMAQETALVKIGRPGRCPGRGIGAWRSQASTSGGVTT